MSVPTPPPARRAGHGIAVLLAVIVPAGLGLLAMTWGTTYLWPDYVHVDYGFPLPWGTHQLNSIAGPVDRWAVDLWNFGIDFAFWLGLAAAAVAAIEVFWKR